MNPSISLYIHIPFCEVKCGYCDFYSVPRGWREFDLQEEYVKALCNEIDFRLNPLPLSPALSPKGEGAHKVKSIFFGGGTPSLLRVDLLETILNKLGKYFSWDADTEITMETNPKTIDFNGLKARRALGINRISIGVQSFQDRFLKTLGRIHSAAEAKQTIENAFKAGFENVNLDLMFALPGQTPDDWSNDLETALSLGTPHLSCYNLTIEAGTAFYSLYSPSPLGERVGVRGSRQVNPPPLPSPPPKGGGELPGEDTALKQFRHTRERLTDAGLPAYEISNFAKPGFECLHNQNYWQYGEYLGFGVAAAGFRRLSLPHRSPSPPWGEGWGEGEEATCRLPPTLALPPKGEGNNKEEAFARRTTNVRDLQKYIKGNYQPEIDRIDLPTAQGEFVMLALRTREGVSEEKFAKMFGVSFTDAFGNVLGKLNGVGAPLGAPKTRAEQAPPLQYVDGHWQLTKRGIEIADAVIMEFISL